MPTSYNRGSFFERYIFHWLNRNDYYIMRGAGSHGIFDLVCVPLVAAKYVGLNSYHPFGIQIKSFSFKGKYKTYVDSFLWSKEFELFRAFKPAMSEFEKYVFIFDSDHKKETPIVLKFDNTSANYINIDVSQYYEAIVLP